MNGEVGPLRRDRLAHVLPFSVNRPTSRRSKAKSSHRRVLWLFVHFALSSYHSIHSPQDVINHDCPPSLSEISWGYWVFLRRTKSRRHCWEFRSAPRKQQQLALYRESSPSEFTPSDREYQTLLELTQSSESRPLHRRTLDSPPILKELNLQALLVTSEASCRIFMKRGMYVKLQVRAESTCSTQ